ncbi:hypothetical protein ACP70R_046058 [Stipagrostis hirtigluma subsp. patula]
MTGFEVFNDAAQQPIPTCLESSLISASALLKSIECPVAVGDGTLLQLDGGAAECTMVYCDASAGGSSVVQARSMSEAGKQKHSNLLV